MDQYSQLFAEARAFILACYNMSDCASLNVARIQVWKNKKKRNSLEPPKLCSLPPTEAAFRENALRAHMALAIWLDCLKRDPPYCAQLIMSGTILRAAQYFSLQLYLKALLLLLLIYSK